MSYSIDPVAIAHSPFKEKFGIPRQPGLAKSVITEIELLAPYANELAFEGLEKSSHIWLLFLFHQVGSKPESLRVRPPRLGGNSKVGVFATRSTHRPNGIGQSVVKLEEVKGTKILVSGADLLDQTPIIDIKPYIPYSDSIPDAQNSLAPEPPKALEVVWTENAQNSAKQEESRFPHLQALIEECLSFNPSPAYKQPNPDKIYGAQFWDLNVCWRQLTQDQLEVVSITRL